MKALHIGCCDTLIDGWINSDNNVACWLSEEDQAKVMFLNAEIKFPFKDNELDFIYSEHVIEHLTYNGFKNYISECYRCLKPGGVVRTACPYLDFYIELWLHPNKYKEFIEKHCKMFHNELLHDFKGEEIPAMFVLNDNLKMWDHQVMYDKKTLIKMFSKKFKNIKQCDYQESEYKELQGIEHDNKRGHDHNILETIIFECKK